MRPQTRGLIVRFMEIGKELPRACVIPINAFRLAIGTSELRSHAERSTDKHSRPLEVSESLGDVQFEGTRNKRG